MKTCTYFIRPEGTWNAEGEIFKMYGIKRANSIIIPIDKDELTIGRHTSNNIVINALPVSRYHTSIIKIDGRFFIKDKNTVNGTYIKKNKLLPDRETLLKVGDVIGIGCKAEENSKCTFEVVLIQQGIEHHTSSTNAPPDVDHTTDNVEKIIDKNLNLSYDKEEKKTSVHLYDVVKSSLTSSTCTNRIKCLEKNHENRPDCALKLAEKKIVTDLPKISADIKNDSNMFTNVPAEKLSVDANPDKNDVEKKAISADKNTAIQLESISVLTRSVQENMECIDLISDEEEQDIKPVIPIQVNYSTQDEIVLVDSDDEFPDSQLNTTHICDVPDFSSTFSSMYDEFNDNNEQEILHCTEDTWFEPLSQSNFDGNCRLSRKLVVDLPMINCLGDELKNDELRIDIVEEGIGSDTTEQPAEPSNFTERNILSDEDVVDNKSSGRHKENEEIEFGGCLSSTSKLSKKKSSVSPTEGRIEENLLDSPTDKSRSNDKEDENAMEELSNTCNSSGKENSNDSNYKKRTSEDSTNSFPECYVVIPSLSDVLRKKRKFAELLENTTKKKSTEVESSNKYDSNEKHSHKSSKKSKSKKKIYELSSTSLRETRELRKERLKQLAISKNEAKKKSPPPSLREPVKLVAAKLTKKNRGSYLIDSLCNDAKSTISHENNSSTISLLNTVNETSTLRRDNERKNESVVESLKSRGKSEEMNDSYMNDVLDIDSGNTTVSNSVVESGLTFFDICERNVIDKISNDGDSVHTTKRIAHKSWKSASGDHKVPRESSACLQTKRTPSVLKDLINGKIVSSKSNVPSTMNNKEIHDGKSDEARNPSREVDKYRLDHELSNIKKKSNLKVEAHFYVDHVEKEKSKKKVQFCQFNEYNDFDCDPEERLNKDEVFASRYKINESLIKGEIFEFENAIANICKWNVSWLKEQQKNILPPPDLYRMVNVYADDAVLEGEYKEKLKNEIFQNIWNVIFNSWNKPDEDNFPLTQFCQGEKNGYYTLLIESVDASRTACLWTLFAFRNVGEFSVKNDLINGQIVILSFYVKRKNDPIPRKTNAFAYVASVSEILFPDGVRRQRIIFKIFQKDFEIMTGEVKIKVLTYMKTQLRPFQALAMVIRSPITNILLNQNNNSRTMEVPNMSTDENFLDVFLDSSQKMAIVDCMNHISSSKPSICLVDGAPGTGKSQIVVSLIHELFSEARRKQFPSELKILIIANSDNTADDLTYRLEKLDHGVSMNLLRYGNCKKVHHKIKYCTLDDRIRNLIEIDDGVSLIDMEEEKRNIVAKKNSVQLVLQSVCASEEKKTEARMKLDALNKEYEDLLSNDSKIKTHLQGQVAREKAIENANVIVTSANTCWSSSFETDFVPSQYNKGDFQKFTVCIFDDANHMTEVGMLVPIMLLVRTLILIGDSKNVFHFREPSQSPFLRMVNEFEENPRAHVAKLDTQHRMQPAISTWFSECYNLNFKFKSVTKSPLIPMLVISLKDEAGKIEESERWKRQAVFCCRLLIKIMEIEKSDATKIAVIVLKEEHRIIFKEFIQQFKVDRAHKIRVDTLDEIGGRDNEIVVLCFPSMYYQLDRCLYVACTRARSNLFICGYFDRKHQSQAIQWLLVDAKIKKNFISCSVNDECFPENILRADTRVR